jgi:hypothetical protein|tara:strand:+ start:19216 stop:20469 length:1254 start_codon:yes stop_codon:yes gene_type:complete
MLVPKEKKSSQSVSVKNENSTVNTSLPFHDNRKESANVAQFQHLANKSSNSKKIAQLQERARPKKKQYGLPDQLKSGIEQLSGIAMDDVTVHRNSSKPAQLQAHAYAQGTNIHLAPGQEKHLAHEAWHVVQQKQGRVNPTLQMKGNVAVNDDASLEREADVMGAKAVQMKIPEATCNSLQRKSNTIVAASQLVVQRYFDTRGYSYARKMWADAEDYVLHLNNRLDIRTHRGDKYIDSLKENIEAKGRKAAGTLAGEAYETFQWDQPKGTSIVYGPGGTSGGDLKTYESLTKAGDRAKHPKDAGEVKSASSGKTYLDGVANAYHDRKQHHIIMYPTDESIAPNGHHFTRAGIKYAIYDKAYGNGAHAGSYYKQVATIELPDQDIRQFLYLEEALITQVPLPQVQGSGGTKVTKMDTTD